MGRYDFQSPGAHAGGALMEVMAQQRAEQRQRLLDEVTRKNAESQRAATEEHIKASQAQTERQTLESILPGLDSGQDISTLPQDRQDLLTKYGRVASKDKPAGPQVFSESRASGDMGIPTAETIEDPSSIPGFRPQGDKPAEKIRTYTGTEDDRRRTRVQNNMDSMLARIKADPNLSQLEKTVMLSQAMEQDQLPGQAFTAMQPENPYMIFDQEKGTLRQADPINGKVPTAGPGDPSVLTHTRPPRMPTPPARQMFVDNDGKAWLVDMRTGAKVEAGLENPQRPGAGGRGGANTAILPQAVTNQLNILKGKATPKDGMFASAEADPQAYEAYTQAVNGAIAQAYQRKIISADVADTVRHVIHQTGIVDDPANNVFGDVRPTIEIIEEMRDAFDTPQEAEQFAQFLTLVRGN